MDNTGQYPANSLHGWLTIGLVAMALAGCGGGGSSSSSPTTPTGETQNSRPEISGTPPSTVRAGSRYSFQPSYADADGDTVTFQIYNKPSWAQFNEASGALTGTPTSANVGTSQPITISVSDGNTTVSLSSFSILVQSPASNLQTPANPPASNPQTPANPPASNPQAPANAPPSIAGTPSTRVTVGESYAFNPSVSDANGDSLTFSISNQPAWTTFSPLTGSLTGTPTTADVGTFSNIVISVTDGRSSTQLSAFAIAVDATANGSATVSWTSPTEHTDGSALSDLAGFRVYYGTNSATLDRVTTVNNPGLTTYVVQNLSAATWHFAVRAITTNGIESDPSNIASKTIQ